MAGLIHPHRCPLCGSTDIAYDFDAVITFRVEEGALRRVLVLNTHEAPDLWCDDCMDHVLMSEDQADAAMAIVDAFPGDTEEITLWERPEKGPGGIAIA